MTISRIEPLDKQKSKVFLDGDFAFVLYRGELYRYQLAEGCELKESLYEELLWQVVGRRAREKALSLLQLQGRSEYELRTKLKRAFYPEIVIDQTVSFLTEYGFLNDENYVRNYLEVHGGRKSRAELERDLLKKGLSKSLIRSVCQEQDIQTDSRDVIAALLKKRGCTKETPPKERQKTIAYLLRRGFSWSEIREAADFLEDFFD